MIDKVFMLRIGNELKEMMGWRVVKLGLGVLAFLWVYNPHMVSQLCLLFQSVSVCSQICA